MKGKKTKDAAVPAGVRQPLTKHIHKYWQWYVMMLIPVIYYLVFRYVPMAGNVIAFRRYRAGSSILGDEWSGLKYFRQFINDQNFWRAFRKETRRRWPTRFWSLQKALRAAWRTI